MRRLLNKINDMLAASALAEMGLHEAARDMVKGYDQQNETEILALPDECQYGDKDACFIQG